MYALSSPFANLTFAHNDTATPSVKTWEQILPEISGSFSGRVTVTMTAIVTRGERKGESFYKARRTRVLEQAQGEEQWSGYGDCFWDLGSGVCTCTIMLLFVRSFVRSFVHLSAVTGYPLPCVYGLALRLLLSLAGIVSISCGSSLEILGLRYLDGRAGRAYCHIVVPSSFDLWASKGEVLLL